MEANSARVNTPRWLRWALIFGLPALTEILAHSLFVPRQETNDDSAMMLFASGAGLSPEPTPYLLFMNALPGQLLSSLYRLWPGHAWYALFMLSVRLLAGIGLLGAVLPRRPSIARLVLSTVWFVAVEIPVQVCPQFSITAAAAAQAAILLWLTRSVDRAWKLETLAAFLGLIGLGVMVRADHALLIAALAAPLLLIDVVSSLRMPAEGGGASFRSRLTAWGRRTGWPFLAAGSVAASLLFYQWWFYASSPGWKDFFEFNTLRAHLTDLVSDPAFEGDAARLRAGWSANDLALIKNWFFADPEVYSPERLRAYLEGQPGRPPASVSLLTQLQIDWRVPTLRLLLAAATLPALFLSRRTWARYGLVCAAAAVIWVVVAGIFHHHTPVHFITALLTFIGAAGIALAEPGGMCLKRMWAWAIGAAMLAVPLVQAASYLNERSRDALIVSSQLRKQIRALHPLANQLYLVWGGVFPFQYILPYSSLDEVRRMKMLPQGSATRTPIADLCLRNFGISDVITALYTRDDIFVIAHDADMAELKIFIAEHRGINVEVHSTFNKKGRLFNVYQLRQVDAPPIKL